MSHLRQYEYRLHQYCDKYFKIRKTLTKDNINTYLEDILNILCIPYGIGCYATNNNNVVISNGILHRKIYFEFKKVKITSGVFWGYYTTYHKIDTSNLVMLYKIAKLICTTNQTTGHIQPSNAAVIQLNISLLDDDISSSISFPKLCHHINLGFIYDDTIESRIDAIKDAMFNAIHRNRFTATAIPYEPVATEVTKSELTAPTLAEAEVVA